MRPLGRLVLMACAGFAAFATACGSPPPEPGPLLERTSQHMTGIKSFHFVMEVQGDESQPPPVQNAEGDAQPPDLKARAGLRQGQVLVEINLIFSQRQVYLKSFTGGWQQVTPDAVSQFFDLPALFARDNGLFAILPDTLQPTVGKQETVDAHSTYPVTGRLAAHRVHRLLPLALNQGDYGVSYWIQTSAATLWRARIAGTLFDPKRTATVTFTFSRLDEPVFITPPPVG